MRRLVALATLGGDGDAGASTLSEIRLFGIGLNPHYGTPGNARDRARVPGGGSILGLRGGGGAGAGAAGHQLGPPAARSGYRRRALPQQTSAANLVRALSRWRGVPVADAGRRWDRWRCDVGDCALVDTVPDPAMPRTAHLLTLDIAVPRRGAA